MLTQAHRITVSVLPWRRLFGGHIEHLGLILVKTCKQRSALGLA